MTRSNITKASLDEIKKMEDRGEVHHSPNAPIGDNLGPDFWANAQVVQPKAPQPVLLKLDPEVLEFFKTQGKGHLTRMQNVLRAYVNAHRQT